MTTSLDVNKIRADFPILAEKIRNKALVYLDNAATCQKPQAVIDSIVQLYSHDYANVHRGVHTLSVRATDKFEGARTKVKDFINAVSEKEIIFVRGATEAINLVAQTYGKANLKAGDEILITAMEHHSNIVPWQMLCEQTGAILKVAPINQQGELIMLRLKNCSVIKPSWFQSCICPTLWAPLTRLKRSSKRLMTKAYRYYWMAHRPFRT